MYKSLSVLQSVDCSTMSYYTKKQTRALKNNDI